MRYKNIVRASVFSSFLSTGLLAAIPGLAQDADDLAEIYNIAAENDPVIREARQRYNASNTLIDQGRSQLLPNVSLSATTARQTQGPSEAREDSGEGGFVDRPPHSFSNGFNTKSYSLSVSQNLLNFQAWYSFQSAKYSDRAAAMELAQAEQELIMRVAQAYFDVLRSIDNLEAFRAEEEASQSVLEQTQERFEVGLVPVTDVYDSQANYDLARVNRIVEENNLEQRLEALEAITGRTHRNIETLDEDFPIESIDPDSMAEWVALARQSSLLIRAAEFNYEASVEDAKAARAAMYPTADISVSYGWRESGGVSFFGSEIPTEDSSIGLNVSVPLFTGGLNQAQKRQAYYNRNAAEEVLLRTQRETTLNTRNTYRSVETQVQAVEARRQAITSAQSALEATEVGAEVGTRNVVDVVLAQRTLFQAQRDYANARYDYVINTLLLKQAAGVLSPQDVYDLNQWLE